MTLSETAPAPAPPAEPAVRILFAADGSPSAREAMELVTALPLPTGSEVRVLTVAPRVGWRSPEWVQDVQQEWAERTAGEAASSFPPGRVDVPPHTRCGDAAHEIIEAGRELNADLIVVGSRGLTGIPGLLLGSVARGVAHHADRPVLFARAPTNALREVVLAVDGSAAAQEAAHCLARLPLPRETGIAVVHVVRPYCPQFGSALMAPNALHEAVAETRRRQHTAADALLHAACSLLEASGKRAVPLVREGDAAEEILKLVEERGADLVVVGARGWSRVPALRIGSVSERLLGAGACSVLVAPPPDEPTRGNG